MAEYAEVSGYLQDEIYYVILAEDDGLTITYRPEVNLDGIIQTLDSPLYKAALKGEGFLSMMFRGAYSNAKVLPYNDDNKADYEAAVERFVKNNKDAKSRFVGV